MTTTPTPPANWTQVPSWQVTRELLRSWGFAVASCPTSHEEHKGQEFGKARHAAWAAGWVVLASEPEAERVRRATAARERLEAGRAAAAAWVAAQAA